MEKTDHRQTASCGSSKEAKAYRAKQKQLIESGQFKDAVQMDINDITSKFGNKYDQGFKKTVMSETLTDDFGYCHVFYNNDNKCEAIEIFDSAEVYVNNRLIFLECLNAA